MNSQEIARTLQARRQELAALMEKYQKGVDENNTPIIDLPSEVMEELEKRQADLIGLQKDYERTAASEIAVKNAEELANLNRLERRYVGGGSAALAERPDVRGKTLGDLVIGSWEYKNRKANRGKFSVEIEGVDVKTLLTTAGAPGFVPPNDRTNLVVPYPNRRPMVADIIPTVQTTLSVINWMEEVTFTNNASQIGEGVAKVESALDWDAKSVTVSKIAHWIPATTEQLDDVPQLMQLINNDLTLMLLLQEETQLLYGNGVGSNLTGFLSNANLQSQALSTNNADTVLKAITKVSWTGFASPTAVIMNPSNWETIRLLKGATNQDYVLGSPLIDVAPRLWGLPVIVTNAISAGTALVGDFTLYSTIYRRSGIQIDVSDSHDTYFIYNKVAIRAEERLALQIKRGSAFCQCTGLT